MLTAVLWGGTLRKKLFLRTVGSSQEVVHQIVQWTALTQETDKKLGQKYPEQDSQQCPCQRASSQGAQLSWILEVNVYTNLGQVLGSAVETSPGRPKSHSRVPGFPSCSLGSPLHLPASAHPGVGETAMMAQVLEFLLQKWETHIEFPVPKFDLDQP